jgi:hypothetical protein
MLIEPIFWRDLLFSPSPVIIRAARVIIRSTGHGRGAGIGRWITYIWVRDLLYGAEEMDLLHAVLMHATNLRFLEVNQGLPHGMLASACLHTPLLQSLCIQLPREGAGVCFSLLPALVSLRVLRIWATSADWHGSMPSLHLPALRILAWSRDLEHRGSSSQVGMPQDEQAAYDAAFLAVSRFPLLEDVALDFEVMSPDGAGHLRRFFQEHPRVRHVYTFLPEHALLKLLPVTAPVRLDLEDPVNPLLADAISPAVQELVLTFADNSDGCETFMKALADRCFCGAHLSLREIRVQLCVYVPQYASWQIGWRRFQWKHWIFDHHCLGDIVQAAVDLEQFGVVLLDEDLEPLPPGVREDWEFARRYGDAPLRTGLRYVSRPGLRSVAPSASRSYESRGIRTRLRSLLAAWQLRR